MMKPSFNKKNLHYREFGFSFFYHTNRWISHALLREFVEMVSWEPLDSIAKDVKMHSCYGKQFSFSSVWELLADQI
jgi:hypothetical protein